MTEESRQSLASKVVGVRRRIEQFRRRRRTVGEQNTKAVLIDPILSALGWDLEDLDEVTREYRRQRQDNPVDYALFLLRSPSLFIEAKGLGKRLTDRKWISQTLGYATVVGIEWCVLTDGDEYRLYNAHAPVDVEEKLFRKIRISEAANDDYLLDTLDLLSKDNMGEKRLNALWKAHFVDRNVKTALDDLFQNEDRRLINLIRKKTPSLKPAEIRDSLKRADIQIDFPVATIQAPPIPSEQRPPMEKAKPQRKAEPRKSPKMLGVKVLDLIETGLINAPLDLEKDYKGAKLKARIETDGKVVFAGETYKSLSLAAAMARKSIIGAPPGRQYPQTNGWTFWKFRDTATGKLEEIHVIRQRYLATTKVKS